jgi:hypothetical protein
VFEGVDVRTISTAVDPWQLRYVGVGTHDYRKIDLVITTLAGLRHHMPPGDPRKSGVRSATGIVGIQRGSDTILKFTFVETGTDVPVVLGRVVLSLFDLDLDGREVTVSDVSEYFVSRQHELKIQSLGGGNYRFSGDGVAAKVSNASVLRLWQESLRSMVSLKFRQTASFTIRFNTSSVAGQPACHTAVKGEACYTDVIREMAARSMKLRSEDDPDLDFVKIQSQLHEMPQDSPCPAPCADLTRDDVVLEFAGWSKLVDNGKKIVDGTAHGPGSMQTTAKT